MVIQCIYTTLNTMKDIISPMKVDDRGKVLCPICSSTITRTAMKQPRNELLACGRCKGCKAYLRADVRRLVWVTIIPSLNAQINNENNR